jgi:hypothetical protein
MAVCEETATPAITVILPSHGTTPKPPYDAPQSRSEARGYIAALPVDVAWERGLAADVVVRIRGSRVRRIWRTLHGFGPLRAKTSAAFFALGICRRRDFIRRCAGLPFGRDGRRRNPCDESVVGVSESSEKGYPEFRGTYSRTGAGKP